MCYPRNSCPPIPQASAKIAVVLELGCIIWVNISRMTLIVDRREMEERHVVRVCGLQMEVFNDVLIRSSCSKCCFLLALKSSA